MNKTILPMLLFIFLLLSITTNILNATTTDTVGGTTNNNDCGNQALTLAAKITASSTGTLQTAGIDVYNAAGNVRLGVYQDNAGTPGTFLGNSVSATTIGDWNDQAISNSISIISGNTYWIAVQTDNTGTCYFYDSSPSITNFVASTYGTFPLGSTIVGAGGRAENMRMTYTTTPANVPTLTFGSNSLLYGQSTIITATCPGSDTCAVRNTVGGTNLCSAITTCSYNSIIDIPGTNSFVANDITAATNSLANTLVISKAPIYLTLNNCGNQAYISIGYTCITTGQQSNSLYNQVLANLNLNGASVGMATTSSNTVPYTISNSVNENIFIFSEAGNGNYLSNTITASWFGYVPISLQTTSTTINLIPTNAATSLASNTINGIIPFRFEINSPSSTVSYTLYNAFAANVPSNTIPNQYNVANIMYQSDNANMITGTWIFWVEEEQYGNTITANELFSPLNIMVQNAQATNGIYTCIQYFPCAVNSIGFASPPTSYKVDGYANTINGVTIVRGTNSLILPLNIQVTYGQFSPAVVFNLTYAFGQSVNTLAALPFNLLATNSAPTSPIARQIYAINTFDQHSFNALVTQTTALTTGLFNNYTISNQLVYTASSFGVYIPQSNFQNPNFAITTATLSSSAASHFLAINTYCPTVLTSGNYMTLNPYLVDLNGSLYTFNIYSGYSTGGSGDFMWILNGLTNASSINVQQVRIVSSPFALALENGQSYAFRFYGPNCNFISQSNYSIWPNPISLNIPSTANVPTITTANIITSCIKTPVTFNTMSVTCTGTDTSDLVSSWSMRLYNVSSISGWYQFNSLNSTTASFSQTFAPLSNFSPLQVVVQWSGSGFSGAKPYQFNNNVIIGGLSNVARGFIILLALLVGLGIGVAGAKSGTIEAVHAPSTTIIIEALIIAMLFMVGLLNFIPNYVTISLLIVMIYVGVQSHRHESGGS